MKTIKPTMLSLALLGAFACTGVRAQSNADLLKELKDLRARVDELEKKLAAPTEPKWGMTPEQAQDFNRIAVKTEGLEDNQEAMGFKGLKISGFADPTYLYNVDRRRAGFQFLNAVNDGGYSYDNSYFGAVTIDFLKEMDGGVKWHLTLTPNRGTGSVIGENSIINEASVMVPLGDLNTRFIAGHIPDWSGYEYQPATQNKLITHNLLFDLTLPTAYTGAGMEVVSGKWDVKGMLANVNKSLQKDNRRSPALVARADYSKGEFNGWGAALLLGKVVNPADPEGPDTKAALLEADGYFTRGDWTFQGQVSYGRQAKAAITPAEDGSLRDAVWVGASGLMAYKFIPRWEATTRLDFISNRKNGGGLFTYGVADDHNGIGPDPMGDPNVGANRTALTAGLSFLYTTNTTFKLEYRLDHASLPVFLKTGDGSYSKNNSLLGTSVVVAF